MNTLRNRGFTLIELLVACVLLVMIVMASSFVFDHTGEAIRRSQAVTEINVSAAAFGQAIRTDIRGAERNGYLVMGCRTAGDSGLPCFGNRRSKELERAEVFRADWLMLMANTELSSAVDSRLISQWTRIFYGHGTATNPGYLPSGATYKLTTGWELLRHQFLPILYVPLGGDMETPREDASGQNNSVEAEYIGLESGSWYAIQFNLGIDRGIRTYMHRDFRWYRLSSTTWQGGITTPTYRDVYNGNTDAKAYYEPAYWQDGALVDSWCRWQAMAHCGEFKVQYAMSEDLRAAADGGVAWRDPPAIGETTYADPNYRDYRASDPAHASAQISGSTDRGRLVFAPYDVWPVLLKITVRSFDPRDRLDDGLTYELVIPLAR